MGITIVRHALPPWVRRRPRLSDGPFGDARTRLVLRDLERGYSLDEALRRSRVEGGSTAAAYLVQNNVFAMTAGAKTVLMTIPPAGHGLSVTEIAVSFDGITAAVPALVEMVRSTQATAGTSAGSVPTPIQVRGRATGGQAPTSGHNYTAEPTVLTGSRQWYISPNGGVLLLPFPLGREVEADSSGGTVKGIGIRVNVTANVNCLAYMEVEALG